MRGTAVFLDLIQYLVLEFFNVATQISCWINCPNSALCREKGGAD